MKPTLANATLPSLLLLASRTFACDPDFDGFQFCGAIGNWTPWTLLAATDLGTGPDRCLVYNNTQPIILTDIPCRLAQVPPNSSLGGRDFNVQAFTYANRFFLLEYDGGTEDMIPQNVWAQIAEVNSVDCELNDGRPNCNVGNDF